MRAQLKTVRLVLRPHDITDLIPLVRYAGDYDVAKNTVPIPHPYTQEDGRRYIVSAARKRAEHSAYVFAVIRAEDHAYLGLCAVERVEDAIFELGYWFGKPFWNRGYATEAAEAVVDFAFRDAGADALVSGWFFDNPASGRVLEKLGFESSGTMARASLSRGCAVTSHRTMLVREDFLARSRAARVA